MKTKIQIFLWSLLILGLLILGTLLSQVFISLFVAMGVNFITIKSMIGVWLFSEALVGVTSWALFAIAQDIIKRYKAGKTQEWT